MAGVTIYGGLVPSCLDDQFQVNLALLDKNPQFDHICAAYWRYRQKICAEQVEPALKGKIDPNSEEYLTEVGSRVQAAMNRHLANAQGGLSAQAIEQILECMDQGVKIDRKQVAEKLALPPTQPKKEDPKEQKNAASDKETQKSEHVLPALNKNLPAIPDRADELVLKVKQKDQKLAQFIQVVLARHLKEYVIPMMDRSTPESSHIDIRSVNVAWKARNYVNELIYNERDSILGKKGFNPLMIAAALNTYTKKMKEEGSKDPFCSWTLQQFQEALEKILA